jgi:hypothetical protein
MCPSISEPLKGNSIPIHLLRRDFLVKEALFGRRQYARAGNLLDHIRAKEEDYCMNRGFRIMYRDQRSDVMLYVGRFDRSWLTVIRNINDVSLQLKNHKEPLSFCVIYHEMLIVSSSFQY